MRDDGGIGVDAIAVGSVLQTDWDSRLHRVLVMDHIEVLYDVYWPHTNEWGFSNPDGDGQYYRIRTGVLQSKSTAVRAEPLTDVERAIHRPDLPLRLLRSPSMQWSNNQYHGIEHFVATHQAEIERLSIPDGDVALDAPQVFLTPFAPNGRPKRDVKIQALNKRNFSSIELLWRAYETQAPHQRKSANGIGIYRAGFKKRVPAFYLWGSDDRAGFTALAEGSPKPQEMTESDRPRSSRDDDGMTYLDRLNSWRNNFPFSEWKAGLEHGLEQYTAANCNRAEGILNDLIDGLIEVGEAASEATKVGRFKTAVEALNALDAETHMIETGEREQLCELFNSVAVDCGIDPSQYGHGEGLASEWRDW
jgi:hypothetical protein